MNGIGEEEIERLANRLAMLVSDSGEADNAGRAVGALARRLGLSGGQLKAIFMAGAESAAAHNVRVRRLERETVRLRERLEDAETEVATLQRERDALRREAEELQAELYARRRGRRTRRVAAVVAVAMVGGAAAWIGYGPRLHLDTGTILPRTDAVAARTALVRDRPVALHRDPDSASPVLATLGVGTRMTVHRLLWRNLTQWVEVDHDGQTGYVLSTEVDLS